MRKRDLERFRETLLEQKMQIVSHARQMLAGEVHADSDDLPDELDTAVSESSLSFTGRMRERERGLLAKIERSLERIEPGSYGECESCGEEIGLERLRARPVADRCIDCKDEQERLERRAESPRGGVGRLGSSSAFLYRAREAGLAWAAPAAGRE